MLPMCIVLHPLGPYTPFRQELQSHSITTRQRIRTLFLYLAGIGEDLRSYSSKQGLPWCPNVW